jgi:hypothetical protein
MKWRTRFCIVSLLVGAAYEARAAGLSTTFVDVVVNAAKVGQRIEAHGPEGKGLLIKNLGDSPVQLSVSARSPVSTQVKPGAESLPDLTWVSFVPPTINIPAHAEKEIKVVVNIPRRDEYRNRTYQVMVWSTGETARVDGISYNAGLLSCLRIHTLP